METGKSLGVESAEFRAPSPNIELTGEIPTEQAEERDIARAMNLMKPHRARGTGSSDGLQRLRVERFQSAIRGLDAAPNIENFSE